MDSMGAKGNPLPSRDKDCLKGGPNVFPTERLTRPTLYHRPTIEYILASSIERFSNLDTG